MALIDGAPEEIRTPDPQIRSLVLYPAELRARFSLSIWGPKAHRCRMQSETIFEMSRKRAIATGSGRAWQGLETALRRSFTCCKSCCKAGKIPQNLP
jgi:hypothetical protein